MLNRGADHYQNHHFGEPGDDDEAWLLQDLFEACYEELQKETHESLFMMECAFSITVFLTR
jgi:hypothetical protein